MDEQDRNVFAVRGGKVPVSAGRRPRTMVWASAIASG
jgi:hypothetical protein